MVSLLQYPRLLQEGTSALFQEIILNARHTCVTIVRAGITCSSQAACGCPLCTDDPRVAESETMRPRFLRSDPGGISVAPVILCTWILAYPRDQIKEEQRSGNKTVR